MRHDGGSGGTGRKVEGSAGIKACHPERAQASRRISPPAQSCSCRGAGNTQKAFTPRLLFLPQRGRMSAQLTGEGEGLSARGVWICTRGRRSPSSPPVRRRPMVGAAGELPPLGEAQGTRRCAGASPAGGSTKPLGEAQAGGRRRPTPPPAGEAKNAGKITKTPGNARRFLRVVGAAQPSPTRERRKP